MKTKFQRLFLVGALTSAVLIGCDPDKDEDPAPTTTTTATKTQLLTSIAWRQVAAVASPGIDTGGVAPVTNIISFMDACELDNKHTFKTDKTYVDDEGATKCDPADPQTTTGTWEFNSGETKLLLDKGTADEMEMTLVEITSSTLKLSFKDSLGSSQLQTVTVTMTK